MKKNKDGKNVLTACEIQAHRLNQVEYRRLQHNVDIMNDDLKTNLARLQRQAHSIRFHYINVVKVVQTNLSAQLWKQEHGYEIRDDKTKNWLGLMVYTFSDMIFEKNRCQNTFFCLPNLFGFFLKIPLSCLFFKCN